MADKMMMLAAAPNAFNNITVDNDGRGVCQEPSCNVSDGGSPVAHHSTLDRAFAAAVSDENTDEGGKSGIVTIMENATAAYPLFPHSSSMEFNLIREVDADILELGVEEKTGADLADFDEEGRRLEAHDSNASLTELENEALATGGDELNISGRFSLRGDGSNGDGNVDESSNDLSSLAPTSLTPTGKYITSTASSNIPMPIISEDSSFLLRSATLENPKPQMQITCPKDEEDLSISENGDYFLGKASPQSLPKPQEQEIDHEAVSLRANHRRSESFERRLNESAQFAEAVGEQPESLLLRKIIEEDSSSDFDDDDIDEGGVTLILHKDEAVGGEDIMIDYNDEGQNNGDGHGEEVETEHATGASLREKLEPTCVSTDLALMSSEGVGRTEQPTLQQGGDLPQLSPTLEVGIDDLAPVAPAPSPCKPRSMLSRSAPPSATIHQPPCYVDWRLTRQHSSGSNLDGSHSRRKSGISSGEAEFFYRGIHANPPEITKRGMSRGNYAQLHRKAWLEVSDKHHRYGKNLRMYYKHWEALGHPFHMFFDWLDSMGEAKGNPLPDLPEIPRPVLDSDTVLYITNPEITASYALDIVANPADGSAIILDQDRNPVDTGKEGWIFVLRDHVLYGSQKVTAPNSAAPAAGSKSSCLATQPTSEPRHRFHHSSFFSGKAVASAGIFLTDEQGRLTRLYPHSGHYRPGEAHMQRSLFFFKQHGVELSTFNVDMQQIFKVARKMAPKGGDKAKESKNKDKENNALLPNETQSQLNGQGKHAPPAPIMKKSKKTDCLHLMCALDVACFLARKALMIERGVFHQIHKIRRIPKESRSSVHVILSFVNN